MMARSQVDALEWRLSYRLVELEEACPAHTAASRHVGDMHDYVEAACLEISHTLRRVARRAQRTCDFLSATLQPS